MKVKFREEKSTFGVKFGNVTTISDGGFERGYEQGLVEGENKGFANGYNSGYEVGYQEGYIKGKGEIVTEIEITSTVSNAKELRDILFGNIVNRWHCAILSKPKNTLVNNQIIFLSENAKDFSVGWRFRDGRYGQIELTYPYDASVTIGDIYTVYDLGEAQYDN